MSIVVITYKCQCGALLKVEGRSVMDVSFEMMGVLIDHEDVTCG